MSWTAPSTATVNQVLTAAFWNQQVRDNMSDLDRRTTITGATVSTTETTTSTGYADLATVGPAATVTIGSTGACLVALYASISNNTGGNSSVVGFAVSGATTVAAADSSALSYTVAAANAGGRFGGTFLVTALNAGSNTFTVKYRVTATTGSFLDRKILVTPLGS